MHFFLYEIAARVLAIYLCVDCGRSLWSGFHERKIAYVSNDVLIWLLDWSSRVVHRDNSPVLYWMQMGSQFVALLACLFVAAFGWPSS